MLTGVVYAGNAMRLRWAPAYSDSVYPFFIGVLEFTLVETLVPGKTGQWLLLLALIYGAMVFVSHKMMRRARLDGDNEVFFKDFAPATLRDFVPTIAIISALALAGAYIWINGDNSLLTVACLLGAVSVLGWQFHSSAQFWRRTVTDN